MLLNAQGGAFCATHEIQYGSKCRIVGCTNDRIGKTLACEQHAEDWSRSVQQRSRATLSGVRRAINRPGDQQEWQRRAQRNQQPHDEEETDVHQRRNYFTPNHYYCVETVCAPCGVVIAWTKFAKAESPTNILNWLQDLYPTESSRPNFICIDKVCRVLCTAAANGSWNEWKKTSHFIVDSHHYKNHKATDDICRMWCNPAPSNGSQPNLVGEKQAPNGNTVQFREFNTEACEQLNAWLGGFESILKRMTVHNFDWLLHVLLFYHVKHVIKKIEFKNASGQRNTSDSDNQNNNKNTRDGSAKNNETKSDSSDKKSDGSLNGQKSDSSSQESDSSDEESDTCSLGDSQEILDGQKSDSSSEESDESDNNKNEDANDPESSDESSGSQKSEMKTASDSSESAMVVDHSSTSDSEPD